MSEKILYTNMENFEADVIRSNIPVAVDFYSEDCPPCAALAPKFDRMSEKYGDYMKFIKIFRQQNRPIAENYGVKSSPTIMFFNKGQEVGRRLTGYISKPDLRMAIEDVLGDVTGKTTLKKVHCDVLIMGGGPAGLSAAIYTSRAKLDTIVVEEGITGGQAALTYHVANYPGTNGVVIGRHLTDNMRKQAESFGAKIDDLKEIFEVNLSGRIKYVRTEDTEYYARAVIIATGAQPRKLPAEGESEFRGRGVHYCATCDGAMYQDSNLIVVGGGNAAVEEAVFLTRYAKHVTIVHQFDQFQASMIAQEEALKNNCISVIWNSEIRKVNGENHVKNVTIENVKTGQISEIPADGVFVYIGTNPNVEFLNKQLALSSWGYIITDNNMKTSIEGVFAAGDVREKTVRQIATAVGDGVVAAISVEKYLYHNR